MVFVTTTTSTVRLNWGTRYEVTVLDLGLACCGVEVMAALHGPGAIAPEPVSADAPEVAHVLVVSGTVTDVMLPAPPEQVLQIEATQAVNFPTPYDINTAGDGTKWQQAQRETSNSPERTVRRYSPAPTRSR